MNFFVLISLSYLIGSIPFGLVISYITQKKDPRLYGSKNIGATNVLRLSGWKLGLLTLFLDFAKSIITLKYATSINPDFFSGVSIALFLGHVFPIWLKFKGGKGIAVFIGIIFSISLIHGLFFLTIWLTTAIITRYSSLSALVSSISILVYNFYISSNSFSILLLILNILIFFKHKDNIIRIFNKKESKIKVKIN
tara:strand:- start:34 stop:618 length:585 start_codon:yes stop_codon:yes gene_type:complete